MNSHSTDFFEVDNYYLLVSDTHTFCIFYDNVDGWIVASYILDTFYHEKISCDREYLSRA